MDCSPPRLPPFCTEALCLGFSMYPGCQEKALHQAGVWKATLGWGPCDSSSDDHRGGCESQAWARGWLWVVTGRGTSLSRYGAPFQEPLTQAQHLPYLFLD